MSTQASPSTELVGKTFIRRDEQQQERPARYRVVAFLPRHPLEGGPADAVQIDRPETNMGGVLPVAALTADYIEAE